MRQKQGTVDDTHFTVRWMSSQNQTTHHNEFGYWSWMDGSLKPVVTFRDGKPEAVTVTPSLFAEYGWTAPEAYGRRSGWTYLESFKTALEYRPKIIMLHQWNEYTGQAIGHGHGPKKDVFLDTYSVEFSDDLEPISPTAPGYRGAHPYGFYYLNLTRALMDIYRGDANDVTLMAVNVSDSTGNDLKLEWTTVGVPPKSFTVSLDGDVILKEVSDTTCSISRQNLEAGMHKVVVHANGVGTRYKLSHMDFDNVSDKLMPVEIEKTFMVSKKD